MDALNHTTDLLWRTALAAVPLIAVAWVACRAFPLRSSTRHALWVAVLAVLLVAPFIPAASVRGWMSSLIRGDAEIPPARTVDQGEAPVARTATPLQTRAPYERGVSPMATHPGSARGDSALGAATPDPASALEGAARVRRDRDSELSASRPTIDSAREPKEA